MTRPDKTVYVQDQVWAGEGEREAFSHEQKFDVWNIFKRSVAISFMCSAYFKQGIVGTPAAGG